MEMRNFYSLLNASVDSFDQWENVLASICELSGATKGIIALRSRKTAELIIPEIVNRQFSSPLLFGFSEEEVGSYIGHYWQFDPWTEFERKHHPYLPYSLSTHIPLVQLKETEFWPWLEPQGINDTIVCFLADGPENWVALNLYTDSGNTQTSQSIIDFLNEHMVALRRSWLLCDQLQKFRENDTTSQKILEVLERPAFIFDSDCKLISANSAANALFFPKHLQPSSLKQTELPRKFSSAFKEVSLAQITFDRPISVTLPNFEGTILLRLVQDAELVTGKHSRQYLASFQNSLSSQQSAEPWLSPLLTLREKQVVKAISEGSTVPEFAKREGISLQTAKTYARDARRKLGGVKAKALNLNFLTDTAD